MFDEDGWNDRLQNCADSGRVQVDSFPGKGDTSIKTMRKYWDEHGVVIALTFTYSKSTGSVFRIKRLVDGDTVYVCPPPLTP